MDIQYEHNCGHYRCINYARQTDKENSQEIDHALVDYSFSADDNPAWIGQPLQPNVVVVKSHYENRCRISTNGGYILLDDEQRHGGEFLFSDNL